jgi:hypothetical protein
MLESFTPKKIRGRLHARARGERNQNRAGHPCDRRPPRPPSPCASRTAYEPCGDCKSVKACALRFTMAKVREAISDVLDRMTIADMVAVSEGGNITPIVSGRSAVTGRKRR